MIRLYVFALLVSLTNWAVLGVELTPDTYSYVDPAVGLIEHGIYGEILSSGSYYPTAFRTPGTSIIIAAAYLITRDEAVAMFFTTLIYCFLAPFIPLYAHALGRLVSSGAAIVAYLLMLAHANLHFNAVSVMSDLPFAAFFAISNMLALKWWVDRQLKWNLPLLLGCSIGFLSLIRPTGLYWCAGFLALMILRPGISLRYKLRHAAIIFFVVSACVIPWMLRNYVVQKTASMETIKGLALIWAIGDDIVPSHHDTPEIRQAKNFIISHAGQRGYYYYYNGYDYAMKNQGHVSELLATIAAEQIRKEPIHFFTLWKKHFLDIFRTQIHYDEWLRKVETSPWYGPTVRATENAIPRLPITLYHISLEMRRVATWIVYLFLPGLLLLLFKKPLVAVLQTWNLLSMAGLTAVVQGYDRFRLPLDPVITACAAIVLVLPYHFVRAIPALARDRFIGKTGPDSSSITEQ